MQTKPFKLVAVALANKIARIAFAIMRGIIARARRRLLKLGAQSKNQFCVLAFG